jgi:hypothetical protein
MRRFILILAVFALLLPYASAWGPKAHRIFCEQAVSDVWGEHALTCLEDDISYCIELGESVGGEMKQQCLDAYAAGVDIDPSNAPAVLFNDVEDHYNYDSCPLKWIKKSNEWICSGEGNPAGHQADYWFNIARSAEDMCQQVRAFCTGSFYYTSSYFPLLRVKYLQGCISGPFDVLVDEEVVGGEPGWEVRDQCTFSYMKQMAGVSRRTTQHISFIVGEGLYISTLGNLTEQGFYVRNPGLMGPTTTSTSTTSSTVSTSTTLPPSTTTLTVATTSTTASTTTLSPATTMVTASTIASQTTSTTTSTTSTTVSTLSPELNESMDEIDSLLGDMMDSINKTKPRKPRRSSNLLLFCFLALIFVAAVVLIVYVYSMMRRPAVHYSRKVVLPPSARRRMRKGR